MSVVTINGVQVEFIACKKHAQYQDSRFVVLSCKHCTVRRIDPELKENG